jgi:hypothetical protein
LIMACVVSRSGDATASCSPPALKYWIYPKLFYLDPLGAQRKSPAGLFCRFIRNRIRLDNESAVILEVRRTGTELQSGFGVDCTALVPVLRTSNVFLGAVTPG